MPKVVKILFNEDGEEEEKPAWHYVQEWGDSPRTLCTGEVFGYGEGSAVYETREGKITCLACIRIIKEVKSIKL